MNVAKASVSADPFGDFGHDPALEQSMIEVSNGATIETRIGTGLANVFGGGNSFSGCNFTFNMK